ncbi:MAG: TetR/AcrR family transcriptional regulator [Candidatus Methanomethylophilaceae archaeon]|nr:TetR/AcrR family transcriptional regulator [Candidatus Methanomethylophilaceae archaeon]
MSLENLSTIRKNIDERREESRRMIMLASLELFYRKGYQQTTTRDIVVKTGLLNGSIYNRFKSKEDILLSIVKAALEEGLGECAAVLEKESNPLIAAILPGAMEIELSSRSQKIADIIYEAHRLWGAVDIYSDMNIQWFSDYLDRYGIRITDIDDIKLKMCAFLGAIGNICGMYAHGGTGDVRRIIEYMCSYISVLFTIPVFELSATVDRIMDIISENRIRLFEQIMASE